jgi:hypothetical protein
MDQTPGSYSNKAQPALLPPPPKTSDTSSTSSTSDCSFTLNVQVDNPTGSGAMYDDGAAPTSGKGLAGYTWNQAITAITGGLGDGSYGNVPAEGTWSNPQTLETAHWAILSIRTMMANYVTAVNDARDSILKSWSGPAADAFKATLKSFTDYMTALADEIGKYNEVGPHNLLHIAHMNEAMSGAAGFIWAGAKYGDGHDRNTPVILSGDLTYTGTMIGAAQQMLITYDSALTALNE